MGHTVAIGASGQRVGEGTIMERRGSDLLREKYAAGGFALDDAVIDELAGVLEEFDLRDVYIKGTPRPDFLRVTVDADDIERCGTVVRGLAGLLVKRGTSGFPGVVKVFPKGIPWPEALSIQMDIG